MQILLTGGQGYVGRSLYEGLKDDYNITSISRADFDLTDRDACNSFFKDKEFDCVIHTAVKGGSRLKKDDDSVFADNLKMYYNLIANKDHFTRMIQFGSGAEKNNPTDPYGLSKSIIADLMKPNPNYLNLRIYAVFDHNELDTRFIKNNIQRYIDGKDFELHEDKMMDFFFMEDLVSLVKYHLNEQQEEEKRATKRYPPKPWLLNDIDCVYAENYWLSDILKMINKLSDRGVSIPLKPKTTKSYLGKHFYIPVLTHQMKDAIKKVYNKMK